MKIILAIALVALAVVPVKAHRISFIQQGGSSTTSNIASEQCLFSKNVTPGDSVIVYVDWGNCADISSVTDQFGNTYVLAAYEMQSDPTWAMGVAVYYATIPASESPTINVNFNFPALAPEIEIYEFSGIQGIDANTTAEGWDSSITSGSVNATGPGDLLFGACTAGQVISGEPWWHLTITANTNAIEWHVARGTGPYAATWTQWNAYHNVTALVAFNPSSPPTPTPVPSATPTATPTPTPTPTPSPTPTPAPSPTPSGPLTYQTITSWPVIFDDEFSSSSTIDQNGSAAPGFNWYPQMFYGFGTNPPSDWSLQSGVLSINGANDNWNDTLHTAHPAKNPLGWAGTCFAGGGGIYFEASIAMNNIANIGGPGNGWPAFWLSSIKQLTTLNTGMLGNPGVDEFLEDDIMEYNPTWFGGDTNEYQYTIHDWISDLADGQFATGFTEAETINPGDYHAYGMLYVPASASNGWLGYAQAYLDGLPGDKVTWTGNQTYSGVLPPTALSIALNGYLFSEMDRDQFMLILGSSTQGTPTMSVHYVRVYAINPGASLITN